MVLTFLRMFQFGTLFKNVSIESQLLKICLTSLSEKKKLLISDIDI